jgi:hypothetical protein
MRQQPDAPVPVPAPAVDGLEEFEVRRRESPHEPEFQLTGANLDIDVTVGLARRTVAPLGSFD